MLSTLLIRLQLMSGTEGTLSDENWKIVKILGLKRTPLQIPILVNTEISVTDRTNADPV